MITLVGNINGRLHVQRQVEDYTLRPTQFEAMGFLTFTVETYERRIVGADMNMEGEGCCRYLLGHPKKNSHYRVCRLEGHNSLPNIVGTWPPRRDGEENTKSYYYAAMLALLKPWRDLRRLKADFSSWKLAFDTFMETANQRDRDVVAGCQYYYDSRTVIRNEDDEVQPNFDGDLHGEIDIDNDNENDEDEIVVPVSDRNYICFVFIGFKQD